MKHLKLFESFGEEDIHDICEKYRIENYTINEDGSIDVDENVDLSYKGLAKIPLKFRNVSGYFSCSGNQLTSLEGCPKSVGGDFHCYGSKITTFEHLPLSIGGDFFCAFNPIFEIWKLFKDYDKIEFLNDCDAVREPNIIILDRLNFFLEEIGKPTVTKVKGYKCI